MKTGLERKEASIDHISHSISLLLCQKNHDIKSETSHLFQSSRTLIQESIRDGPFLVSQNLKIIPFHVANGGFADIYIVRRIFFSHIQSLARGSSTALARMSQVVQAMLVIRYCPFATLSFQKVCDPG